MPPVRRRSLHNKPITRRVHSNCLSPQMLFYKRNVLSVKPITLRILIGLICRRKWRRPAPCIHWDADDGDRQHLQDNLNKLTEWSEKWQILFIFGKCKCLQTGHGNTDTQFTMGGTVLNTTVKEMDLELYINADMKVLEQCGIAGKPNSWIN